MGERDQRLRWARLRPENRQSYPAHYLGQWLRVPDRHHPDIPGEGDICLAAAGGMQKGKAAHFEIAERHQRRILVADDEAGIRQALEIVLTKAGYEVFQARDGEEASRMWRSMAPDLIIADIHMLSEALSRPRTAHRLIRQSAAGWFSPASHPSR